MRETLEDAARQELRRVHEDQPGAAPWPAHPLTLAALVRRGLLSYSSRRSKRGHQLEAWSITGDGRAALEPREVFRRQADVYLTRAALSLNVGGHGEYTTDPGRALCHDDAPIIDPASLDRAWTEIAEERRAAADDRRERARRSGRGLRATGSRI
jgi:hypothetical protein